MPNYVEDSDCCDNCGRQVLVRMETPNHILHLLICLFCCGWWLVVWFILAMSANSKGWRCSRCGMITSRGGGLGNFVLLFIIGSVGAVLIFIAVVAIIASGTSSSRSKSDDAPPAERPADPDLGKPPERDDVPGPAPMAKKADPKKVEPGKGKEDIIDGLPVEKRKAVYARLAAERTRIEAAALKKFGKKSVPGDPGYFQYSGFIDEEMEKAYNALNVDEGILPGHAQRILKEGDAKGWPKK
jgi:hypothetical protein